MSPFPNFFNPSLFSVISSTIVLASAVPSLAASTQIVGVEVTPASNGVELHLKTAGGGDRPQVFAVPRGNSWVADVTNTQLKLASGSQFSQQNPAAGIRSITVAPLDANSIRITINGTDRVPEAQLTNRDNNTLTFGVVPATANEAASSPATPSETIAQNAAPVTPPSTQEPEVLFPNPEITITDNGTSAEIPVPRANPAPAFLPRAVAPPLGDIAVSNLIPNIGDNLDLGTAQRVPRLVLRDAPAREVLSLLARAAGLNLAYIGGAGETGAASAPAAGAGTEGGTAAAPTVAGSEGPTITLDIENEPVQDVFNYVLKLTQLEAVRQGRTILVGPELPQDTRNTIIRSLRINQAKVSNVSGILSVQGAETQRVVTRTIRTTEGEGTDRRVREETTTEIKPLSATDTKTGAPLTLQGLSVFTDERLNTVTLIGEPSLVELATSIVRQTDLRQRQVAVNVKIIDINLLNTQEQNASFSFGLGNDAFIVNQNGNASLNFGELAPSGVPGTTTRPIIDNPYNRVPLGINFNQPTNIPSLPGGGIQIINDTTGQIVGEIPVDGSAYTRSPVITSDGLQRVFDITDGKPGELRFTDSNVNGVFDPGDAVVDFTNATIGALTQSLPSVIQYPNDLLLRLRAQIVSGNAKILTDPTLTVQEGNSATINLTQEVFAGFQDTVVPINDNLTQTVRTILKRPVGLILELAVDRIDDNGFITLAINPTVSSISGTFNVEGSTSPAILTAERTMESGFIRLRDGQTLVLAGVIQDQDRQNVSKWPILGDIPIIGALFRNTETTRQRTEVVIVVTPQILDDSDNSTFGYGYTPGPEVQQVLDRPGQ